MTLRSVIFDLDCTLAERLRSLDTYLERFGDSLRAVDRQIVCAALGHADAGGHAADAVYVGDHPVNDVQGATEAGLTAIWLRGWQGLARRRPAGRTRRRLSRRSAATGWDRSSHAQR
ncbi:MAG: HAD hydrolase-like protein, partial [Candidatus Latescibacterota bacterium]